MKYKITETEGCMSFDFTINDESLMDIPNDRQIEILDYLFAQYKEQLKEGTVLFTDFVKMFQASDWGHENGSCGCCGDSVSWATWEV